MVAFRLDIAPVAKLHSGVDACAFDTNQIGLQRSSLVTSSKGFVVTLEIEKGIAKTKPGLRQIGLERQRFVVCGKRFINALELTEGFSLVGKGIRIIRVE